MRSIFPASFLFLLTTITVSSCKKEQDYTPNCNGAAKTYTLEAKPAIQSNCVSCHSNYGSYNSVKNDASAIRSAIANGSMPKGKSMSDSDKDNVLCWIDAGAPNN